MSCSSGSVLDDAGVEASVLNLDAADVDVAHDLAVNSDVLADQESGTMFNRMSVNIIDFNVNTVLRCSIAIQVSLVIRKGYVPEKFAIRE